MIEIYTDGGFRTKNREVSLGASASVQIDNGKIVDEVTEIVHDTTNQQTELLAVIIGLNRLYPTTEPILVHSDSAYIVNCFKWGWYRNWRSNGWRASSGNPVKNRNLWETLLNYVDDMNVEFIKVKGHSGNFGNERADELVNIVMDKFELEELNGQGD